MDQLITQLVSLGPVGIAIAVLLLFGWKVWQRLDESQEKRIAEGRETLTAINASTVAVNANTDAIERLTDVVRMRGPT